MWDLIKELYFEAFIGSLLAAVLCSMVGSLLYLKRNIFLGLALPQVSAAGISFGLFILPGLGYALKEGGRQTPELLIILTFAFVSVMVIIGILLYLDAKGKGSEESRIAGTFAGAWTATILFLNNTPFGKAYVDSMITGEALSITKGDLFVLFGLFIFCLFWFLVFSKRLLIVIYDPEFAVSSGISKNLWLTIIHIITGLTIAFGVTTVGPLVVFALLALPSISARILCFSMRSFLVLVPLIGLLSHISGWLLSLKLDLPLGPSIALGSIICLVLAKLFKLLRFIKT